MKITDPDVIKNGEKDLIDAVKQDLDLDVIKQILEKKITAAAMSPKGGQIIVHNNEIAFRLDFDLNLTGSLMFDRQGNYIPETDDDTDLDDITSEEDALDQELDTEDIDTDKIDPDTLEDDAEDDLEINLPEYDLDDEEQTPEETLEPLEDDFQLSGSIPGFEDETVEDDIIQDDMVHNDINDILKESQEFWDKKKDQ